MSAGNTIVQIRRNQGRLDFIPAYSTAELLHGVCHVTHFPKNDTYSPVPECVSAAHAARQEISRKKFEANKEEIYALLAHGRGIVCVARQFKIGVDPLRRYLEEDAK